MAPNLPEPATFYSFNPQLFDFSTRNFPGFQPATFRFSEKGAGHGVLAAGTLELSEDEAVVGGGIGKRVVEGDTFVEIDVEGL